MQLFSRRVVLTGPPLAYMEYATKIRDHASEKIGRDIGLWAGLFGGPIGTMLFTAHVEGVADLRAATEGLMADEDYHKLLEHGRQFMAAPAEDQLGVPIYGELADEMPPVGSYAQVVTATVSPGMYEQAIAWGVEIAQHVEGVTGVPELVMMGQFGEFGTMTWAAVTEDAAAVDRANAAMNSDEGYMKRLGEARELFVPGSGVQGLLNRIG